MRGTYCDGVEYEQYVRVKVELYYQASLVQTWSSVLYINYNIMCYKLSTGVVAARGGQSTQLPYLSKSTDTPC